MSDIAFSIGIDTAAAKSGRDQIVDWNADIAQSYGLVQQASKAAGAGLNIGAAANANISGLAGLEKAVNALSVSVDKMARQQAAWVKAAQDAGAAARKAADDEAKAVNDKTAAWDREVREREANSAMMIADEKARVKAFLTAWETERREREANVRMIITDEVSAWNTRQKEAEGNAKMIIAHEKAMASEAKAAVDAKIAAWDAEQRDREATAKMIIAAEQQAAAAAAAHAAEQDRAAAAYNRLMAAIDPVIAQTQKYEAALAKVMDHHRLIGSSTEALAADMDKVREKMSPAAIAARELAAAEETEGQALDRITQRMREAKAAREAQTQATQGQKQAQDALNASVAAGSGGQVSNAGLLAAATSAKQAEDAVKRLAKARQDEEAASNAAVQSADRLVKSYAPMIQKQRQLAADKEAFAKLQQANTLSAAEEAAVLSGLEARTRSLDAMQKALGGSTKAQAAHFQSLKYQLNDVVSGFLMGQPPMMIFVQQGGQIIQALDGMDISLKTVRASTLFMVGGLTAGAVAFGVAFAAAESFMAKTREVANANTLMGGSVGRSSDQFLAMAERAAEAGQVSVASAREQEAAYIRSGKIGADTMERLIGLSRDYAAATKQDTESAAKDLSDLFSDPVAGAKKLSDAYGLLSGKEMERIRQLKATGQEEQARLLLADQLAARTRGLGDQVGTLAQAWERVARAASNAFNAVGQAVAPETNNQAIARLEEKRRQLLAARGLDDARLAGETGGTNVPAGSVPVDSRYAAPGMAAAQSELASVNAEITRRQAVRAQEREMAARVGDWQGKVKSSAAADEVTQSLRPMSAEITTITGQITKLQSGLKEPGLMAFADDGKKALEGLQNQLSDYQKVQASGLDIATFKSQKLAEVDAKYAGQIGPQVAVQIAQEKERINVFGTATTAAQRKAQVDAATAQAQAGVTQAASQATHELTLQTQAQERLAAAAGLGEAAQRRANIENQVAAAAVKGLEGATRTALEAQEKFTQALIHNDFARGIDQEVAATERLVAAMANGAEATRDAEIYNAAYLQTLRETTPAEANWGEKLKSNIDLLNRKAKASDAKAFADYSKQLEAQNRQLDLQQRLIGAPAGQAARLRAEADISEMLIRQGRTYESLTEEERKVIDAARDRAVANADLEVSIQRQQDAYQTLANSLEKAFDRVGDALVDAFVRGEGKAINFRDVTKAILASLMSDMLKMAVINPFSNAVFGTNRGTLWDLAGGAANQNGAGGAASTIGGVGNMMSAGQSLYSAATGSTASTMAGAGTYIAESSIGHSMGLSTAYPIMTGGGTAPVTQVGTAYAANSSGTALSSGLGAIGAAAPYGALGGIAGSYIGNAAGGNKAVGGLSGAAIGVGSYAAGTAAMGAMGMGAAASAAGVSGMAGATAALSAIPVYGWIAAAVIAAVAAIAGTQKPSTQYAQAWARTDNTGSVVDKGSASAKSARGKVSALEQRAEGVASLIGTLTQAGGFDNRGIVLAAESDTKGQRYRIDGLAGPVVSRSESGTQVVLDVLSHLRDTGEFKSGYNGTLAGRTLDRGIGLGETDMEGFAKGLALARQVEAGTTALREFDKSLSGVTIRAKQAQSEALKPMTEELALAAKYGFEGEYRSLVNGQLSAMLEDLANPKVYTETQVEAATFTGQIAAMREELSRINPELAKTIDGIEKAGFDRIYKKVRTAFDASLNEAQGQGYRNQLTGVRDYWNTNALDMLAAGRNPNDLYFAQAKAIIEGLSNSQIDDVVSYFRELDPVMSDFADSLRDTTAAAKEAQKAVQANADSLTAWLNGQKLGDASSLSPWEKMQEAQRQFDAAISSARQTGDISGATRAADSLLSASKPALVMGTDAYSQREAWITSTLKNLGHELGLPGFKTGGSFEVGGWGGVDSTLVRFMATPGERVTVTRPGQQAQSQTVVVRDNEDVVRALSQMVGVLQGELRGVREELSSLKAEKRKDTNLELMRKAS